MAFFLLDNYDYLSYSYEEVICLYMGGSVMEFVFFKDALFDLINECDQFDIKDIVSFDTENRFCIIAEDGTRIEILLREL